MHLLSTATYIGLFSGIVGTGIGAIIAFAINNKLSNCFLCTTFEFAAGLMTCIACFRMLPDASNLGGVSYTVIGLFAGIIFMLLTELLLSKSGLMARNKSTYSLLKTGIMTAIGIAVHNLPEGFAIGTGFEVSTDLGITLALVIILHDVPEGIATAIPIQAGGFSRKRTFLFTVLSGAPTALGALAGSAIGYISDEFMSASLGFAAGTMLYISYVELLTQSKRLYAGKWSSLGSILGIICGIIISVL